MTPSPATLVDPDAFVPDDRIRCQWAQGPWNVPYHDTEWGVPVHDDRTHFEFLVLEGAQAGLSWLTVLKKREGYRRLFADFDVEKVARFTPKRIERILGDPGIVRNRAKVEAAVGNARAFAAVQEEFESFDAYLWEFVDGRPKVNRWRRMEQIPSSTPLSDALSADLRGARLPFRRSHGLLLPPAGGGTGQRPPGELLPPRRARRAVELTQPRMSRPPL